MQKLILFSDPHLGLSRSANTTPESRKRLTQALYDQAMRVTDLTADRTICLGDVFDKFQVDNTTLLQGLDTVAGCDFTLVGNHDYSNRVDALSSLHVLLHLGGVRDSDPTNDEAFILNIHEKCKILAVDHKMNQELFNAALAEAYKVAELTDHAILLLHCNYDNGVIDSESTLNLDRAQAEDLLKVFDYIFIGHEHEPRLELDNRLILVGNTHPTGFSDISDKYYWEVTIADDGSIASIYPNSIWSEDDGYLKLSPDSLGDEISSSVQFVDVVGEVEQSEMPAVAKKVNDLWAKYPSLLAVRNRVSSKQDDVEVAQISEYRSLPERISDDLKDTDISPVWSFYLEKIGA